MKFEYSTSGIPFIQINKRDRIIFSNSSKSEKGFRYLILKADILEKVKNKNGKNTLYKDTTNLVLTVDLKGKEREINSNKDVKNALSKLKHILNKYIIKNTKINFDDVDYILPFNKVKEIENEVNKN